MNTRPQRAAAPVRHSRESGNPVPFEPAAESLDSRLRGNDDADIAMAADASSRLSDRDAFQTLNGLWKGKKPPYTRAVVIRNTNFTSDGILDLNNVAELDVEAKQLMARELVLGDIIIERSGGGPKQAVGRVCYFDAVGPLPYSFSNFTSVIRVLDRKNWLPRYVHYFLMHLYRTGFTEGLQHATTGIRNLDFSTYLDVEIPRRPMAEQEKIAAVLWKLQQAIQTQDALLRATRDLKAAAMQRLFTHGLHDQPTRETLYGDVSAAWDEQPLGACCRVQTGVTKGRKIAAEEAIEVPYLRVANVQDGHLDLREIKTITIRQRELYGYLLQEGDVVLTEGGDFDKLGRGFIWHGQVPNCVHQNHVFAVRANREVLTPEFLAYLVQSPYGKTYFLTVAHKTTNLASINSTKLKALPVLLPSLDEQRDIAAALATIDRKLAHHQRKRAALNDLFQTLLQQLMTAQLRVAALDIDTACVATRSPQGVAA